MFLVVTVLKRSDDASCHRGLRAGRHGINPSGKNMPFSVSRSVHGETAAQVKFTVDAAPAEQAWSPRLQDCAPWHGIHQAFSDNCLRFLGHLFQDTGANTSHVSGLCSEGRGPGAVCLPF